MLHVVRKICPVCLDISQVGLGNEDHAVYLQWSAAILNEDLLRNLFPHLTQNAREVLLTGTHPNCLGRIT